jgi:hypothetical protein
MQIKKTIKNKIFIIMILVVTLNFFSLKVFAQDSDYCQSSGICWAPSDEFKNITSFMKEVIGSIKTIGTRDPYVGEKVSPNWFKAWNFDPPKQWFVSKLVQEIRNNLLAWVAVISVFTQIRNLGWISDFALSFFVLFKNDVFIRDYKTLSDIDWQINQKKLELGLGWGWFQSPNKANLDQLNKILDKYSKWNQAIFISAKINDNASYEWILMKIVKINSAMKSFISLWKVDQFGQWTEEFVSTRSVNIRFDLSVIDNMAKNYKCAKHPDVKCNKYWSKFKESVKKIKDSFKLWWFGESIKIIKDSFDKFKKENFKKEQDKLLRNTYGIDYDVNWSLPSDVKAFFGSWVGSFRSAAISAWKNVKDFSKTVSRDLMKENDFFGAIYNTSQTIKQKNKDKEKYKAMTKQIDAIKDKYNKNDDSDFNSDEYASSNIFDSLNPNNQIVDLQSSVILQANLQSFESEMDNFFVDMDNQRKWAVLSNNVDVTSKFESIFNIMSHSINDIIWKRWMEWSLVESFGKVCKEQCENKWGKCYF